ncbi:MAG: hypothetical protein COA69_06675 [Robiginitomaculum sp.]|nr:MAG: hypothetical protein COA69_06675 [Robiginitomaculum sp.]
MSVEPLYQTDETAGNPSRSSVFLRRLITVLWYVTWALLAVFIVIFLCSGVALMGIEPLKSQLFNDIRPSTSLVSSLSMIVGAGAFLIILKQLRQICQTLVMGDPFVPENAHRLRIIWIAVAIAEVLRLITGIVLSGLMVQTNDTVEQIEITLDLRIYVWFLVLALIILSEVFREGARMRQEQKLTV